MSRFALLVAGASASLVLVAAAGTARAQVNWPLESINRPLTMPGGTFQVGAVIAGLPGYNLDTNEVSLLDTWALGLLAGYGITDELELLATYGLTLSPFEGKGTVRVGPGYAVLRGAVDGKLEVIARADVGYDLLGEHLAPITIGPQIQFNLTPQLAIISPSQFGNWLSISIDNPEVAGVSSNPVTLSLPVGVLFQATPNIFAQADTTLLTIGIADADNTVIFADYIPVNLTLGYTPANLLDVGVILTDELKHAGDTFALSVFARFYGGV